MTVTRGIDGFWEIRNERNRVVYMVHSDRAPNRDSALEWFYIDCEQELDDKFFMNRGNPD